MPQLTCDRCIRPAVFLVYSAYTPSFPDPDEAHPTVKRYPQPMIRSCEQHLANQMWKSAKHPGDDRTNPEEFVVKFKPI